MMLRRFLLLLYLATFFQVGISDLHAQVAVNPIKVVPSDPSGTCPPAREDFSSSSGNPFYCNPLTQTWTQMATGGGGATTCGSTPSQLCYNNAGAFGGITGATSDGTNLKVNLLLSQDNHGIGIGPVSFTPTSNFATVELYDATPMTGQTRFALRAGANQNSGQIAIISLYNTAGSDLGNIGALPASSTLILESASGDIGFSQGGSLLARVDHNNGGIDLGVFPLSFGSTVTSGTDTSVSRISAAKVGIGSGAGGSHDGTLQAATIIIDNSSFTFNGHTCTIVANVVTCP